MSVRALRKITSRTGRARRVVGLDLGSTTGWAVLESTAEGRVTRKGSGIWRVRSGRDPHEGTGYERLEQLLETLLNAGPPIALAVEDVRRHVGTRAAHVYGALRGVAALVASRRDLAVLPVGVGLAKKRATGNGNASKAEVVVAAQERFEVRVADDNEADALFVALCGLDIAAAWHEVD